MKSLAIALAIAAIPTVAAAADVEAACTRTVLAYADAWDHGDAAKFAALFAPDATLDIGGGELRGAAITEAFAKGRATTTRHLMTNIVITPGPSNTARGRSYLMLVAGPAGAPGAPPIASPGFNLIGEYVDEFRVSGTDCRIAKRQLLRIFRRPPPPQP